MKNYTERIKAVSKLYFLQFRTVRLQTHLEQYNYMLIKLMGSTHQRTDNTKSI
jgi:hypothetical protein